MLRHFSVALASSWLLSPLGVLILQLFGLGQDRIVIMFLFGSGACVPFQLLMNECLAAGKAHSRFSATILQMVAIIILQFVTCFYSLSILPHYTFDPIEVLVLATLLSAGTYLSYNCAVLYYKLVLNGALSIRASAIVGALPGVTLVCIYTIYGAGKHFLPSLPSMPFLTIAILPAVIQWRYLNSLSDSRSVPIVKEFISTKITDAEIENRTLILSGLGLVLLTIVSSFLRDAIVGHSQYAALVIVCLNSLTSLANVISRVSFLSTNNKRFRQKKVLLYGVFIAVAAASLHSPTIAAITELLAVQLCIIAIVNLSRGR